MKGLTALRRGKFNDMQQEPQPDGSVIVTLFDRKLNKVYKFRVVDIGTPTEREVEIDTR